MLVAVGVVGLHPVEQTAVDYLSGAVATGLLSAVAGSVVFQHRAGVESA